MARIILTDRTGSGRASGKDVSQQIEAHLVDATVVITVEFSRQEARNLSTLEIVLSPDEAESLGTQTQVHSRTARRRKKAR
jgi:hypothetical protein